MKKHVLTLSAGLLLAFAGMAQNHDGHNHGTPTTATTAPAPKPEAIKLSETTFDFGKIPQGKPVTHMFTVENIGKDSLKIDNVQASCGCTTPEWNREPIAPNGTAKIKVGYNAGAMGAFTKPVTIKLAGIDITKQVNITGEVVNTESAEITTVQPAKAEAATVKPATQTKPATKTGKKTTKKASGA